MVLQVVMPHHQVVAVMLVVVLVLVVEESLLFMQEHTPITELLPVMVEQVVVVDLAQDHLFQLMIYLELVEQEQLLLFRLMLQHNIKV
tara:strand:- start:27 stop:290 length:264 start_codon:yes stop_codon:yes gene_type:complete